MNGSRLSDAELGRLLRARMPAQAGSDVREAIMADVETTRQLRSVPGPIGALLDVDPKARRRALLLAATLLLALTAAVAGAVGAFLERKAPDPLADLSIPAPADLPGFVASAYGAMPDLPPMTITTLEDGTKMGRIYVDGSGAIRVERFSSPDATAPETYTIYAGTSMGELVMVGSEPAWYQQDEAISEDPRVFVYAELGRGKSGSGTEYGCETATSPEEVYTYTPGSAWRYVGLETVAGRPAHHVACDGVGDMWIDVETRLTLRSQGQLRGPGGWPVAGALHTIEVTAIELGQPSAALFEMRRPEGVRALSAEEYERQQCVRYGWCLASPRPVITPPPALGAEPLMAADELVRLAGEAPLAVGAYSITIEDTNTGMSDPGSRTLVLFDGVGRYRIERTWQIGTIWETTSVTLIGDDYEYSSETQIDGTTIWRASGREREPGSNAYPLQIMASCEGGWEHRGVDVIATRVADHVGCVGDPASEYWIDRDTHLVVRTQSSSLGPTPGTVVQEVVDFGLGTPQDVEWDLPEDADVRS
jgi:hypothetical protein